jgi:hypothetical protein
MLLEAKRRVCQSKLHHVCVSRWVLYKSLSEPWTVHLSLTGRHATTRTNPHTVLLGLYPGCGMHCISDKYLACSDMMNLIDCCK